MVKYYMDQLGIYCLFSKYVENQKCSPVDSAQILSVLLANIVCASRPLYRVEQWAADYCTVPCNPHKQILMLFRIFLRLFACLHCPPR
ncbi:MAG: DUF4277 domain-containing protein [Deltaproteobacteria bacterium]|nr:DUF4277 domain-containing protein [Candidatus Tharpella aukensis]